MARFSILTLLFAAATAGATTKDCFSEYSGRIAESSECANEQILLDCLSEIHGYEKEYLRECYEEAGCSPEDANRETKLAIRLCRELTGDHELRRRADSSASDAATQASATQESTAKAASSSAKASSTAAATTTAEASSTQAASTSSSAASSASAASSTTLVSSTTFTSTTASSTVTTSTTAQTGSVRSGDACFSTKDKSTKLCDVSTSGGRQHTQSCSSTVVKVSSCYDNMLCTTDSAGDDICMILQGIESGGIAIATILGVASLALIFGVFAASMLESKRQKRAAAKAAAIAITRSATMKKQQLDAAGPAH